MHIFPKLSRVFRNMPGIRRRNVHSSTRTKSEDMSGDLMRELYNMDIHQQLVLKQVIPIMAGQVVTVRQDTVATEKGSTLSYLDKGRQLKLSGNPLTFDSQGDVHISVVDESNRHLSIRLSDYISDIHVADKVS